MYLWLSQSSFLKPINYLLLLPILYSLCIQHEPQLGWVFAWCDHINIHSFRACTLTWETSLFTFFAHFGKSIHIPLLKFPCDYFSNHAPFNFMTIQWNHWSQSMNLYIITHLGIFFFEVKCTTRFTFSKFCPLGEFSFTTVLQRCPRKRL